MTYRLYLNLFCALLNILHGSQMTFRLYHTLFLCYNEQSAWFLNDLSPRVFVKFLPLFSFDMCYFSGVVHGDARSDDRECDLSVRCPARLPRAVHASPRH